MSIPDFIFPIVDGVVQQYPDSIYLGAVFRPAEDTDELNGHQLETCWAVDVFFWNEEEGEYGYVVVVDTGSSDFRESIDFMKQMCTDYLAVN